MDIAICSSVLLAGKLVHGQSVALAYGVGLAIGTAVGAMMIGGTLLR